MIGAVRWIGAGRNRPCIRFLTGNPLAISTRNSQNNKTAVTDYSKEKRDEFEEVPSVPLDNLRMTTMIAYRALQCMAAGAIMTACLLSCSSSADDGPEQAESIPVEKSAAPPTENLKAVEEDIGAGLIEGEDYIGAEIYSQDSWLGDFEGMVERRYLRALVVPSKTSYFYDRGNPRGITYEGMKEFERFLNKRLKLGKRQLHVVFIPVGRDQLIPALLDGKGDIAAANLTMTPKRLERVDFSDPILTNVRELIITGPASPSLASLEDLSGKEVYVRKSSSYHESLVRLNQSFHDAGKAPVAIRPADENLEDEDLLEMVNAGLIAITVTDSHKATFWAKIFDEIYVHEDLATSDGGAIGWAFRKGSPKLEEMINTFVKDHRAGTAFGNTVLRRYLRNTKWVRNATSKQEMKKFQATLGLFQKYADKYDFDWLMVAAQAYQESRLNNNARSPVGAIGIMQVMPSTAEAPPISIKQVDILENNIHAGVKILRHYTDHYLTSWTFVPFFAAATALPDLGTLEEIFDDVGTGLGIGHRCSAEGHDLR